MKMPARDAEKLCARPPSDISAFLLFGEDQALVAARRMELVSALTRASGDDALMTEIDPAEVRRDPASVDTALKSPGFFGGKPIVVIAGATDALSRPLTEVIGALGSGDGNLVVTAGTLPARSSLRKLFEASASTGALQIMSSALTPAAVAEQVSGRGGSLTEDAARFVSDLLSDTDYGSARQILEVIALAGLGRAPLDVADVQKIVPVGLEADIDRFIEIVALGQAEAVGASLRRLSASGVTEISLCLALQRHFRLLFRAAEGSGGLAALRPPVYGRRKDMISRQLRSWSAARLEQACRLLFDADSRLRSTTGAPSYAVIERTALRLAMMASG